MTDSFFFRDLKIRSDKTLIMGVLNVTPDSFSDGGSYLDIESAVDAAKKMISEGADIIDVGGESSRPGAAPVSEHEELRRVIPVIKELAGFGTPISCDTSKPAVAKEALDAGAHMINDIGGFGDDMTDVVSGYSAAACIMHMRGNPKDMQKNTDYSDLLNEVGSFLVGRAVTVRESGIKTVFVDPGIGFGKTTEQNLQIIDRLDFFNELGFPILVGASRKSVIGDVTGLCVGDRLWGSVALACILAYNGADVIRVHDVFETRRALDMVDALRGGG